MSWLGMLPSAGAVCAAAGIWCSRARSRHQRIETLNRGCSFSSISGVATASPFRDFWRRHRAGDIAAKIAGSRWDCGGPKRAEVPVYASLVVADLVQDGPRVRERRLSSLKARGPTSIAPAGIAWSHVPLMTDVVPRFDPGRDDPANSRTSTCSGSKSRFPWGFPYPQALGSFRDSDLGGKRLRRSSSNSSRAVTPQPASISLQIRRWQDMRRPLTRRQYRTRHTGARLLGQISRACCPNRRCSSSCM